MRKFVVNVNGNSYEVEVEEVSGTIVSQPVTAPAPQPALTTAPAAPAAAPLLSPLLSQHQHLQLQFHLVQKVP